MKIAYATVAALVLACAGCAQTRFGGMSVHDAFPDERVAKLVEAIGHGDYAEADRQIKAGADVNAVGKEGITPLFWVFGSKNAEGTVYLIEAGADPNYRVADDGDSVVSVAAGGDRPDLLKLLLEHGGDPNLRGPFDEPLLHIAVTQRRKENIDLLLEYGADINSLHKLGHVSAAETAVAVGRFDLAAYLIERGLTARLDRLARVAVNRPVPRNSEAQRWKEKLIEMLKERGVEIPKPREIARPKR